MVFWCAKLQFTWCRWDALGPVSDVLEVGEEVVEGDAGGGRQVGAQARERDPWLEGARLRPDPGVGDKWQRRLDCEVKGNSCQNFKPNSGSSALCFWKAMQLYDQLKTNRCWWQQQANTKWWQVRQSLCLLNSFTGQIHFRRSSELSWHEVLKPMKQSHEDCDSRTNLRVWWMRRCPPPGPVLTCG